MGNINNEKKKNNDEINREGIKEIPIREVRLNKIKREDVKEIPVPVARLYNTKCEDINKVYIFEERSFVKCDAERIRGHHFRSYGMSKSRHQQLRKELEKNTKIKVNGDFTKSKIAKKVSVRSSLSKVEK